ncbi:MAG: hypothetical protein RSA57_03905 [Cetobacterium sp.]|uniref:hypothetical protein n=1 Tax=Bacteria TaxID=2 RepID=UPI002FC81EFB
MKENILNISANSYGEYTTKLNILDMEGFNEFLKELHAESINRSLSGFVEYESLILIEKTLSSFDKVEFDQDYAPTMTINNWDSLRQRIEPTMTERECEKWILNGMINKIVEIIDEDIRYGASNNFYKNLRDFLCLIDIRYE